MTNANAIVISIITNPEDHNLNYVDIRSYPLPYRDAATRAHEDITSRLASLGAYDCHDDCDPQAQGGEHTPECEELQDRAEYPQVLAVITNGNVYDMTMNGSDYHQHDGTVVART